MTDAQRRYLIAVGTNDTRAYRRALAAVYVEIPCASCAMNSGHPCVTPNGKPSRRPHVPRERYAIKAIQAAALETAQKGT